jgi:uncharacterized protein (TIGR02145 family)
LPSDIEWTQLERVLCLDESTTYTTQAGITDNTWADGTTDYRGKDGTTTLSLDKKMKASTFNSGVSKTAAAGGFAALPAGNWTSSSYDSFSSIALFWSSSSYSDSRAWSRYLFKSDTGSYRTNGARVSQCSVRCKKD